ncbi:MAG: hypothetical protein AAFP80_07475 [Pseudomonadota bacterium]
MTFQVADVDLPVLPDRSRFEIENRAAIDAHWQVMVRDYPRLWNGVQFLFEDVRVEDNVLRGTGYRTDFATFIYWRDHRDRQREMPTHIAGTTMPVTSDNALLTIRMAGHTANPGEYYFPAGSLDEQDVINHQISIDANVSRELLEETGLKTPDDLTSEPYIVAVDRGAWHVARRFSLPLDLAEARQAISAHQRTTGDDETDDVIGIYDRHDAQKLKLYAKLLALWHFDDVAAKEAA